MRRSDDLIWSLLHPQGWNSHQGASSETGPKGRLFNSLGWEMIMENTIETRLGIKPDYLYVLIASCMLAGLAMMFLFAPASAAQSGVNGEQQSVQTDPTCTPPSDWGQTTRLKVPDKPSKQWSFTVDEPEMVVTLVFFYYQAYSKAGCPYDCTTGECQTDENGKGESPFGEFSVMDGMEGANRGSKQLSGQLTQGTYQVKFTANGNPGSLNVGLKVRQEAVPTPTPTNTAIPSGITPTATPVTPEPTIRTPEPVDTATPTTKPKRTPPATLPPPTPFPGSPPPQALIPQTGFELNPGSSALLLVVITFGLGIVGFGITLFGISRRLK